MNEAVSVATFKYYNTLPDTVSKKIIVDFTQKHINTCSKHTIHQSTIRCVACAQFALTVNPKGEKNETNSNCDLHTAVCYQFKCQNANEKLKWLTIEKVLLRR